MEQVSFTYQPIAREAAANEQLAQQGYTIFPLLQKKELDKLSDLYFEFQKEAPAYFYSSSHSSDHGFRRRTSDFIKDTLAPLLPQHLKNYKLLGGAYVVKPPHGKGLLQPHQDWNLVDESQFRSYNIWIPLVDVRPENGAVFALNGSHSKLSTYRGPGIASVFKNVEALAWQHMQPLNMKAGEALLYDHALLHGSPANQSDTIRLGIVAGIIPEQADMQLHFAGNGAIDVHHCSEDFFLSADPSKGPGTLAKKGSVDRIPAALNETDFRRLYLGEKIHTPAPAQKSFFSRMLSKLTRS